MNKGRTFCVTKEGSLLPMMKAPDVELGDHNDLAHVDKAPMKVLLANSTAESFRNQLKFPSGRILLNNISDSMNLRDFMEYGAKVDERNHGRRCRDSQANSVDIRKWR